MVYVLPNPWNVQFKKINPSFFTEDGPNPHRRQQQDSSVSTQSQNDIARHQAHTHTSGKLHLQTQTMITRSNTKHASSRSVSSRKGKRSSSGFLLALEKASVSKDAIDDIREKVVTGGDGATVRGIRLVCCSGSYGSLLSDPLILSKLEKIDLEELHLTNDTLLSLAKGLTLASPPLKTLRIKAYNNRAESFAWSALASALSAISTLQKFELDMYYCASSLSDDDIRPILAALDTSAGRLDSISLNNCNISAHSMLIMVSLCQKGLRRLELHHCVQDRETLLALTWNLSSHRTTLKILHIDSRSTEMPADVVTRAIADALSDRDDGTVRNTSLTDVQLFPKADDGNDYEQQIQFYTALNKSGFRGAVENDMTPKTWLSSLDALQKPAPGPSRASRIPDDTSLDRIYYFLRYRPEWLSQQQRQQQQTA